MSILGLSFRDHEPPPASPTHRQPGVEQFGSPFDITKHFRPDGYLPPINGICKVNETGPGTYEIFTLNLDQAEFFAVLQQFRKCGCVIELDGREHKHKAIADFDIVEIYAFVIYRIRVIPVIHSAMLADA